MAGALSGLLGVEIAGGVAAGLCGRLLAGFGATIVKVEPPGGDPTRRARVVPGAPEPDPHAAPAFSYLAMGKRSLVADLDDPDDTRRLRSLLCRADVLVDDATPGRLEALGLSYDNVALDNPRLVHTSLTPFGLWGPYASWRAENINVFAAGGQMSLTGEPGSEPLCNAGEQGWYQTGLAGFAATCLALLAATRTGLGQRVDVSAAEVMAGALEGFGPTAHAYGLPTPRTGTARYALMGIYPCADGHAGIFATGRQLPVLAEVLGSSAVADGPSTLQDLLARSDELAALVGALFASLTRDGVKELARSSGLPLAPVLAVEEVAASEHLASRGFFTDIRVNGNMLTVPGAPVKMRATPWVSAPPPRLADISWRDIDSLAPHERRPAAASLARTNVRTDRPSRGPLEGLRVLDFTAYWLGPYCTKWLGDFGADIIKIESPRRPDFVRSIVASREPDRAWDRSAYFNNYNRGKRSVAIDPRHDEGRGVVLDLVEHCDVVVENFQAGYMQAAGLSYESLRARRPDLVMLSGSGYGASGSDSELAGVGTNMEQLSGIASLNAYPASHQPYNSGIAYADPTGGTLAAAAVLMALMHRDATGEGQHIDLAGHEVLVSLIGEQFAALSLGLRPTAKGNRHPDMSPHGCYPCAGDDRWVTLALRDEDAWPRLAGLIGRPDLAQDLPTLQHRHDEHDEIDASIIAWTVTRSDREAAGQLQAIGVAAFPVLTTNDLLEDPGMRSRGYYQTVDDPDMGPWPHDGVAWRLTRTPGAVGGPAPRFGQHTREVLTELLGMSGPAIDKLYAAGAAAEAPARW